MTDFPVVPARMALINVDMQNCFVENSPIAAPLGPTIVPRINQLAQACRNAGILVVHTAHVVRPDGANIGVMGEIIPPVKLGVINQGSMSASLHSGIEVSDADVVLEKPRFGAFHSTNLESMLRYRGVDTIMVTGVATNVSCETTAREANVRDFRVFFLSNGTATFDLGEVTAITIQQSTCATLGFAFAQIATVDEMIAKIAAAGATEVAEQAARTL